MHLLLTDRLTCPRCGPKFGLILLANRLKDRNVHDGLLGCSNCRDSFLIEEGFGDLRAPPRSGLPPGFAGQPGDLLLEQGQQLLALLGVVGGTGTVALVGGPAGHGPLFAEHLGEAQVVGIDPDLRHWSAPTAFSRMCSAPGLPFFASSIRALAIDGRLGGDLLEEAARVVSPHGRVVISSATENTLPMLEETGLKILVAEAETVVAVLG